MTPNSPSTATVIAWASLATSTAALDASLSRIHSIPETMKRNLLWQSRIAINNNWSPWIQRNPNEHIIQLVMTTKQSNIRVNSHLIETPTFHIIKGLRLNESS
jgi:hypothetical protein